LQPQIDNHLAGGTGIWTSAAVNQASSKSAAVADTSGATGRHPALPTQDNDLTLGFSFLGGSAAILGLITAGVVTTVRAHSSAPEHAKVSSASVNAAPPLTSAALARHNARFPRNGTAAGDAAHAQTTTGETIQSSLLRQSSVHSGSTVRLVSPTASHFADHDSVIDNAGQLSSAADGADSVTSKSHGSEAASHASYLPASPRLIIPPSPTGSHEEHSLRSPAGAERNEAAAHFVFRA
jgi:hypothetical protein